MKKRRRSSGKDEADMDEKGAKKVKRACINACISQSLVISAALYRRSSGKDEADKDEQGAKKVKRACINACISQSLVISTALYAPANRRPGSLEATTLRPI